ncbi:Ubiquinol oxidase 2, mitochondrial [Capsicum annuum]|uniref:Ubiquinol oxidase n=1 Tax=Capsicum annuum TaxID=4072 RepID=A0A2G2Y9M5_CAPAN|nr:Ubiquinol oxidase 2, mitochondrial [Capsicum annuum]
MSTSESRSSSKRKVYGEVTTKRLYESFKENNYPDHDAKKKFEQSGGSIKALLEEAENERMHLMTMVELVQPIWYEKLLVIAMQGAFFNFYFVLYLLSPKLAHRVFGYLEEEAIHSYTLYFNDIDRGEIENVPAPAIAIDYWRLPKDVTLKDVVTVIRVDEAHHRDVNHFISPWETNQADLSIDLKKHHVPKKFLYKIAYWLVKLLKIPTDLFFKERYGCHAMMLETVAVVPRMVGVVFRDSMISLVVFRGLMMYDVSGCLPGLDHVQHVGDFGWLELGWVGMDVELGKQELEVDRNFLGYCRQDKELVEVDRVSWKFQYIGKDK